MTRPQSIARIRRALGSVATRAAAPVAACLLLVAGAGLLSAQNRNVPGPYAYPPPVFAGDSTTNLPGNGSDPNGAIAQERRLGAMNVQRQKALIADTQRLVKLATELNAEINSSQQTQLTPAQLRTLTQIEKLAHSVRDKMSSPLMGITPQFQVPAAIPMTVQ